MRKPFEAVTSLTALQRLQIWGHSSLVPFVAKLTLLTHLQFEADSRPVFPPDLAPVASLAILHRIVHVGVKGFGPSLERHVLASVAKFTSLRSLDLDLCTGPERSAFETVCMTPFSQLTALKLDSYGMDASFLPRFNLERLQVLSLSPGLMLDRDGILALGRATCLTHLELWRAGMRVGVEELGIALSRMSRLCALSLSIFDSVHAMFSLKAIAHLTELTRLELGGEGVISNTDVELCLGLQKLRVLRIEVPFTSTPAPSVRITLDTFFALAKLPELRKFDILGNVGNLRGRLTDDVRGWINSERRDKGWPPLELSIVDSF